MRPAHRLKRWSRVVGIYAWRIVVVLFDILPNVLLGGRIETLSARMGRQVQQGRCLGCRLLCRLLDWLDPNHCTKQLYRTEADPDAGADPTHH